MGCLILAIVGAILGWLTAIVFDITDRSRIAEMVIAGLAGALITGALTYSGSLLTGISAAAFLQAVLGAAAILVALALVRNRVAG